MTKNIIPFMQDITIDSFIEAFHEIIDWKKSMGWRAYYDNPEREVLRAQAQFYGEPYANGSIGWASNIWSRSKASTDVIEDNDQLTDEHRLLMRSALEYILAPNPLIKVDGVLGQDPRVKFHCRIWCDARYPDLPLRWREMTFLPDIDSIPNMEALMLPGLWTPATIPGSNGKTPMILIRFSEKWFTLGAVSSYQGEWKKSCLTHWIYHVYLEGGTGVHAGTRQFTVKDKDGNWKKVGMVIWGLTGSGKSTHGMYMFDKNNEGFFTKQGIDVLSLVKDQYVKNDDIVGLFEDMVLGSEKGAWTKTEDVDPSQVAIYKAGMSPRALHENTGKGKNGNPDFLDEILQYRGMPNRNARTVMCLEDMSPYFDGSIDIAFPPNMAIFISPGYLADYAWLKIQDPYFAAATLAAGRTVGHPAQSTEGVGEEKYSPLYNPFIIGKKATPADHINKFLEIKLARDHRALQGSEETLQCYLINTTGRVGCKYTIEDGKPKPVFEEKSGTKKPIGGSGPSIVETEIFILQEARGLVKYGPHPLWGEKVMCPVEIPGLSHERIKELNPFTYRTLDEMKFLLNAQIDQTKKVFQKKIPELKPEIFNAMDIT